MRALKHDGIAVACAASVALSVVTLLLCSAWLLSGASLVPSLALTAMSVLGSGIIASIESRSPSKSFAVNACTTVQFRQSSRSPSRLLIVPQCAIREKPRLEPGSH
jgi:hypothetical protein